MSLDRVHSHPSATSLSSRTAASSARSSAEPVALVPALVALPLLGTLPPPGTSAAAHLAAQPAPESGGAVPVLAAAALRAPWAPQPLAPVGSGGLAYSGAPGDELPAPFGQEGLADLRAFGSAQTAPSEDRGPASPTAAQQQLLLQHAPHGDGEPRLSGAQRWDLCFESHGTEAAFRCVRIHHRLALVFQWMPPATPSLPICTLPPPPTPTPRRHWLAPRMRRNDALMGGAGAALAAAVVARLAHAGLLFTSTGSGVVLALVLSLSPAVVAICAPRWWAAYRGPFLAAARVVGAVLLSANLLVTPPGDAGVFSGIALGLVHSGALAALMCALRCAAGVAAGRARRVQPAAAASLRRATHARAASPAPTLAGFRCAWACTSKSS